MLFTSVAVELNAVVHFFLNFREVLLIGGENVKTQVQQLNEGVSNKRDSAQIITPLLSQMFELASPLEKLSSSLP